MGMDRRSGDEADAVVQGEAFSLAAATLKGSPYIDGFERFLR